MEFIEMKTLKRAAGLALLGLWGASAVPAQDFSGAYAGLGLSYSDGRTDAHWGTAPSYSSGDDSHDIRGLGVGGIVGYNWQTGTTVYGVEGGLGYANADGDDGANSGYENGTKIGMTGYIAGRVGVVAGPGLFYGSLGLAAARADLTEIKTSGGPVTERHTVTHTGPRFALGMDYPIGTGMLRTELSYARYNEKNGAFSGYDIQSKPHLTALTVGYLMKF